MTMVFSPWGDVEARITARAPRAFQTGSAVPPADPVRDTPAPVAPQACPVEDWLAFLGHRWNALILWHLQAGPLRHRQLLAVLPQVSPKVLAERLQGLRRRGLVERCHAQASSQGGAARYRLAPRARGLLDILDRLERWDKSAAAADQLPQ